MEDGYQGKKDQTVIPKVVAGRRHCSGSDNAGAAAAPHFATAPGRAGRDPPRGRARNGGGAAASGDEVLL